MLLAGGTDLVPNMKHGLFEPKVLVSLADVVEMHGVTETEDGGVRVGAMTTIADLAVACGCGTRITSALDCNEKVSQKSISRHKNLSNAVCFDAVSRAAAPHAVSRFRVGVDG